MTDYSSHILVPEGDRMDGMATPPQTIPSPPGHEIEWLECVKSRKQPSCNPDYHIKVDIPVIVVNRLEGLLGQDHTSQIWW